MAEYDVKFQVDKTTISLIYLAEVYHLDLTTLLLLYDRLGEDVFYFFYLFSGKQVSFPRSNKLLKILKFGEDVRDGLRKGQPLESVPVSEQERRVLDKIKELYSPDKRIFSFHERSIDDNPEDLSIGAAQPLAPANTEYSPLRGDDGGSGEPSFCGAEDESDDDPGSGL